MNKVSFVNAFTCIWIPRKPSFVTHAPTPKIPSKLTYFLCRLQKVYASSSSLRFLKMKMYCWWLGCWLCILQAETLLVNAIQICAAIILKLNR